MMQLALLVPVLALSAATPSVETTTAEAAIEQAAFVQVDAKTEAEEPGLFEKYFPFTFAENLEPETEQNFVMLYISGLGFFFWNIWLPVIMIGNPGDFIMDQIIGTVIKMVAIVLTMLCPPVGIIHAWATVLYLLPVMTVNAFDRNLKKAKAEGTWQPKASVVQPPRREELALGEPIAMAY